MHSKGSEALKLNIVAINNPSNMSNTISRSRVLDSSGLQILGKKFNIYLKNDTEM